MRVLPVGFYRPILTLSMRAFGPRNSAYAFWTTTDTHTYRHISREISIEHPSVGLASLAQLEVLTRRTSKTKSSTDKLLIRHQKFDKNKVRYGNLYGGVVMIERRADVRALFEVRELID